MCCAQASARDPHDRCATLRSKCPHQPTLLLHVITSALKRGSARTCGQTLVVGVGLERLAQPLYERRVLEPELALGLAAIDLYAGAEGNRNQPGARPRGFLPCSGEV